MPDAPNKSYESTSALKIQQQTCERKEQGCGAKNGEAEAVEESLLEKSPASNGNLDESNENVKAQLTKEAIKRCRILTLNWASSQDSKSLILSQDL